MKTGPKGTVALVLAGLFGAFTVYMLIWNSDRHTTGCTVARGCPAATEDRNLMLISGAIAIGLLIFGLIRRYQPKS